MQTKTFNLNGLFDMRSCFWNENSLIELENSRFYCQFEFIVIDEVSFCSSKKESKDFPRLKCLFQKTLQFKFISNGIFYIKTPFIYDKTTNTLHMLLLFNRKFIRVYIWFSLSNDQLIGQLNFQWLENKSYFLLFIRWHLQFKVWSKIEYMLEIDLKIINGEDEMDLWPGDLNWQNQK